jgi:hypothetical protein
VLVVGFGLPVVITWLGYLPHTGPLFARLGPYITWMSSVANYHVRSLPFSIGKAPTMGQSLYIAMFAILNVVFTAVSYESRQPNAWNPTVHSEIMS